MISEAIFARLAGEADLVALIGTKIFPDNAGKGVTGSYLTYSQVSAGAASVLGGRVEHFRTLQQIDIYAPKRLQAEEIGKLIRRSLDHVVNGTFGDFQIPASMFDDEFSGGFDPVNNLHRIIQQYRISWKES